MKDLAIGSVSIDRRVIRGVTASALLLALLPLVSRGATAAGGDFSTNFAAAAPLSYTHATGGGAWNDGTNAEDKDIREELEGGQFTCADTVTYLMKLDVDAGADDNQSLELDFSFLAKTTGQPGAAHADVTGVSINYGDVENGDDGGFSGGGPGTFGLDSAIDDDRQTTGGGDTGAGGSAASIVSESFAPMGTTPFNGADELLLTVRIDDLDADETVVLRIDTTLACDPGSRPTGNLQAKFESGRVVEIDGQSTDDPLTGGAQTIPLKRIGQLTPEPTPAEIQVEKITVPADLPDGFDFTLSGDDDQTITGLTDQDGPRSFDPVDAGTYTVAETEVPGFTNSASCDKLDTQADEAASPIDLEVAAEETWRCTFVNTAIPDPTIGVTKSAEPETVPEPGQPVVFTATVTNTSAEALVITAVEDAVEGGAFFDVTTVAEPVLATTCDDALGTVLDPDDTYECDFTLSVTGNVGDVVTDEARFTLENGRGNEIAGRAPASVAIVDVLPTIEVQKGSWPRAIYEPGMEVTYIVDVTNTSSEPVTITSITDTVEDGVPFDVTTAVDPVLTTTCDDAIGTVLTADGGTYNCQFVLFVTGDAHELVNDVVTVTAEDDDGSEATDDDDQTIRFLNVNPTIDVVKTADPTSVLEPGAQVTFTASVTNTSPEPVWVVGVIDSADGGIPFDVTVVGGPVLATTCDDAILTVLAADGGSYTCTFTLLVTGEAGDLVEDVVAFTVADDDNVRTTDRDDAVVTIDDVKPTIEVTKTDDDATVAAPGADVPYTVTISNTSIENVTITSVTDEIDGGEAFDVTTTGDRVLDTTCEDAIGTVLAPGETYGCTFTVAVTSTEGGAVTDVVRASATDDDNDVATAEDDETTPVTPVADLAIEKTITDDLAADGIGTYLLTVTNLGPSTGSGVELLDELPAGLTVDTIDAGDWDCAGSTATVVSCSLQSLAVGATAAVSVQVDVAASLSGTTVTNAGEVTGTEPDDDLTNNRDVVDATIPVLVLPTQQPAPAPAPPVATAPVTAAPVAAQPLAVTGQDLMQVIRVALVLVITGGAALGFSRGRRASELDG